MSYEIMVNYIYLTPWALPYTNNGNNPILSHLESNREVNQVRD